jgi:DNA modification methylase
MVPWVDINPKRFITQTKLESNSWDKFKDPNGSSWVNRLIHGDSLCGMASLVKSGWANQIQMIYFDPPFGIEFDATFDLAGERLEGYQDRWDNGLASYLEYMRQRLVLCRELLNSTGSIFVQIGEANMHYVRCLLDEIFGLDNFISVITFRTAVSTNNIKSVADYLLWYAKDQTQMKRKQLYTERSEENLAGTFTYFDKDPKTGQNRAYKPQEIVTRIKSSKHQSPKIFPIQIENQSYLPPEDFEWKWEEPAMKNLVNLGRIAVINNKLYGKRFIDDFPDMLLTNIWIDTSTSTFAARKHYTVKTNPKVIRRCIAATTDYGDIILDPTCGSGTTAYVAEEMERRWVTFDTSPSAIMLALSWLICTCYPVYHHRSDPEDIIYQTLPQFSLSDLAHQRPLKQAIRFDLPKILKKEGRIAAPFQIFQLEYNAADISFDRNKFATFLVTMLEKNGVFSNDGSSMLIKNLLFKRMISIDAHQIDLWNASINEKEGIIAILPPLVLNQEMLSKILSHIKSSFEEDCSVWICSVNFSPDCRKVQDEWNSQKQNVPLELILIHPDLLMSELSHGVHPEAFRLLNPVHKIQNGAINGLWGYSAESSIPHVVKLYIPFYTNFISKTLISDLGTPLDQSINASLGKYVKIPSLKTPFCIDKRGTWYF